MQKLSRIWTYCFADGVPKHSLLVAFVVGSVLNFINQGDALLTGTHVNLFKIVLTYVVPYCVATYGAVSYRLRTEASDAPDIARSR
jgi:hypothetical protein